MLSLRGVETAYGASQVLFGVSLDLAEGQVVSLLGRNGMGKSTTVRSIMGIVPPRAGEIRLDGLPIHGLPSFRIAQAGLGLVPEGRQIFPNLTVRENLVATAANRSPGAPAWTLSRVYAMFPRLAERQRSLGHRLSGGEQQMLAIARGLVARPALMLVDEPTEGLAPLLVQNLTDILAAINRTGTTILLVEQTLEVALALSRRLYVMDQGRIQFQGTPEELRKDPTIQQRFLEI
jgi:branched-chain amino acid transport system ATP-binding protein